MWVCVSNLLPSRNYCWRLKFIIVFYIIYQQPRHRLSIMSLLTSAKNPNGVKKITFTRSCKTRDFSFPRLFGAAGKIYNVRQIEFVWQIHKGGREKVDMSPRSHMRMRYDEDYDIKRSRWWQLNLQTHVGFLLILLLLLCL